MYLAPLLCLSQDSVFLKYLRHFPFPPFLGGGLLQPFLNQLLLGFFHHLQSFFPSLSGELVSSCSSIRALVPSPCLVCGLDLVNLLLMKGCRRQWQPAPFQARLAEPVTSALLTLLFLLACSGEVRRPAGEAREGQSRGMTSSHSRGGSAAPSPWLMKWESLEAEPSPAAPSWCLDCGPWGPLRRRGSWAVRGLPTHTNWDLRNVRGTPLGTGAGTTPANAGPTGSLPGQGAGGATCRRASEPVATAAEPTLWSPRARTTVPACRNRWTPWALEPEPHKRSCHQDGQPAHCSWRKHTCRNEGPAQPQINKDKEMGVVLSR